VKPYGHLELTVASPAQSFCEPLSLEEVRAFLRIQESSPADTDEQAMLESFVIAAREIAERYQGYDLTEKQYDLTLDCFPCEIDLGYPLQSVDLICYMDSDGAVTTMTEGTDYIVDTVRGLVKPLYGESWPSATLWPSGAITVRFTRGYRESHPYWSNTGQRILQGMKMLITGWYEGRYPFAPGASTSELPFAVTALFSIGARPSVH
jgi:uncharacterized phiE125 gp8 family phage protein